MSTSTSPKGLTPADFRNQNLGLKLRAEDPGYVPRVSNLYGTIAMAITCFCLAYAGYFGVGLILVFYLCWFPLTKFRGRFTLRLTPDAIWMLLLPAFAILSSIWSPVHGLTLKSSVEYTSSILCAIIIGRLVRTPAIMRGYNIGALVTLLATLASRNYGVDPFTGAYSLVGLFGSKNQVGLYAELCVFMSVLSFFYPQKISARLVFCILPCIVAIIALYESSSAGSAMSLIITFIMTASAWLVTLIRRQYRAIACFFMVIWFAVIIAIGQVTNAQEAIFKSFGKDSTLTGRTLLWKKGLEAGWDAPVLGQGWSAFWIPGNPTAEQMWYQFDIGGRFGFHFHSLFIETWAELGFVGVFLLALLLLQNFFKGLGGILRCGMEMEYIFTFGIAVMFMIRAYVEVDLIGTFGIGPIFIMSTLPRLAAYEKEKRHIALHAQKATMP